MRVSLMTAAGLAALLLAACAPASEPPAPEAPAEIAESAPAEMEHQGDDMAAGDATVDRGAFEGTLTLLEGTVLVPTAGRDITAGFGTFAAGGQAVTIIGAEAPFAQAVELHTHEMSDDGKMAMRKVEAFDVPANGDRALVRGGDHMMFFGVQPDSLVPGSTIAVTVRAQLEDGTTEDISVPLTVAARE
jgi:periplasmic copper chaperone A